MISEPIADKHSSVFDVACHMTDSHRLMRPSSFMELAQDMAGTGAGRLGFGDDVLNGRGLAWVLARMEVRFEKPVHDADKVSLDTWHRGLDGMFFLRDYQLKAIDGTVLVNATSSWILMDLVERRAVRSDRLDGLVDVDGQCRETVFQTPASRISVPKDAVVESGGSHRVLYSDIDCNGHVNNTRYTTWAMDCLPGELVFGHRLVREVINFNQEARFGDTVDLLISCPASGVLPGAGNGCPPSDGNTVRYVTGRCHGQQVFVCELVFE